ncbi:MAG TPA: hypothetical protein VFA12_15670 [Stellaceae bacterium]|nr:hypothetical protein [Stellaceae bacterium]
MDEAAARARLAELDRELARLRHQFDIAMSAFRFEETKPVHERIVAVEAERQALLRSAPEAATNPAPKPTVIPGPSASLSRRPRRRR